MAGPIISAEDLFDPSLIDEYAAAQKKLNDEFERGLGYEKELLGIKQELQQVNYTDSASLAKRNKAIVDSRIAEEKLNLSKQRYAKGAIDLANKQLAQEQKLAKIQADKLKAQAKEEAQVKKTSSAYAQLNEKYKDAAKRAKDLGAQLAGGDKSVEANFRVASAEALNYRNQLVAIDAATGQTQRRVGDYGQELGKLGKTMKATGILGKVAAKMLGFEPEIVDTIKEAGKALKDVHHIIQGVEGAHEANTIAIEAETVAQKEQAAVASLATGGMVALTGAIIAGAAALFYWIGAAKDKGEIASAQLKTDVIIKKNEEDHNKLLEEQAKLMIKLNVLNKTMTQQQAELSLAEMEKMEKISERKKKLGKDLTSTASAFGLGPENLSSGGFADELTADSPEKLAKIRQFNKEYVKLKKQAQEDLNQIGRNNLIEDKIIKAQVSRGESQRIKDMDARIIAEMEALDAKRTKSAQNLKKWKEESEQEETKNELNSIKTISDETIEAHNIDIDNIDELRKKKKDANKEEREEIQKTIDAYEMALQRRNNLLEKQLDNDLEMRQRNILQQQQLAMGGYRNTLAFEKEAAAKDELRKQQLAIKEQKQAKMLAIFKLLAANAGNGTDGAQALLKTFAEMAIATAFAGSAYDGTENTGDAGSLDGKGGKPWIVHPGERIFKKTHNDMIGDISNDEAAEILNAYQGGHLPGAMTAQGSFATNIANSMAIQELGAIKNEVAELKEIFKKIPRIETKRDEANNVTETQFVNGMKKVVSRKSNSPLNYI